MKKKFLTVLVAVFLALSGFAQVSNLSEGFEQITFPPNGWTVKNDSGVNQWFRSTNEPHTGSAHARINYNGTYVSRLITPKISVSASTAFRFYYAVADAYYGNNTTFRVEITTDTSSEGTWETLLPIDNLSSHTNYVYVAKSVDLSEYADQDVFIAFYVQNASGCYIYVDDVEIGDCFSPTGLAVSEVTPHTATVSWTGTENDTWKLSYKTADDEEWSDDISLTEASYDLTDLTSETDYMVRVATDCESGGGEKISDYSTINFTTGIACPKVTGLTYSDLTDNSAVISWTASENTSSYNLSYKENIEDADWTEISISDDTTYNMTGLDPATAYIVKIVADCGDEGLSQATTITVVTKAIPVDVPYTQDFESSDINDFQILTYGGNNAWVIGEATANTEEGVEGGKSMYISQDNGENNTYDITAGTNSYAVLTVNFGDLAEYTLSFDYKVPGGESTSSSSIYDYLSVYMAPTTENIPTTTSSPTIPSTFITILEKKCKLSNDWEHFEGVLVGATGTTQNIIFHWRNDGSSGTQPPAAIDNISIMGSDCTMPLNPVVSDITSNSATVSWTSAENITDWVISYKMPFDEDWTEVEVSGEPTYELTELTPKQQYTVKIAAVCGSTNTAAAQTTFTTLVATAESPYTQDFEGIVSEFDFFSYTSSTSVYKNVWSIGTATATTEDGKSMYISQDNGATNSYNIDATTNSYAVITVNFNDNKLNYNLSFDYKVPGGEGAVDYLSVYVAPETADIPTKTSAPTFPSTFAKIFEKKNFVSDWTHVNVPLEDIEEGSSRKIIFHWRNDYSVGTQPPAAIDNISIVGSDCSAPYDLVVEEITETTAEVSWSQDGDINSWSVQYKAVGETEWQTVDASQTNATLTDLVAGTKYTVKVEGLCSDESVNSSQIATFFTVCSDISLSELDDNTWKETFEGISSLNDVCFNALESATSYSVQFPTVTNLISQGSAHVGGDVDGSYGAGYALECKGGNNLFVLPKFADDIEQLRLKFWYRQNSTYASNTGKMEIGVMTDLEDISTFVSVKTLTPKLTSSYNY